MRGRRGGTAATTIDISPRLRAFTYVNDTHLDYMVYELYVVYC